MHDHIKDCIKQAALGKENKENKKHKGRISEETKQCMVEEKSLYEKLLNTKSDEDLHKYKNENVEMKQMIKKAK